MRIISKNKVAFLNYDIHETFEAWIVLKWFEVKAVKTWKVKISDSIIRIWKDQQIYIKNMHIPLYEKTSRNIVPNYEVKRDRKLLMHKKQIKRLGERTHKTWLVIIPLKIYENKHKLIKLEIALGKLRKKVEKKQILKERDVQRQAQKDIKNLTKL